MFNEEVFKFDIDNIKNDLAIEGMEITNEDVDMYRRFANDELNMPELIEIINKIFLWWCLSFNCYNYQRGTFSL